MNKSVEYFLSLLASGRIVVDAQTGIVYSRLHGHLRPVGARQSGGYLHMSAGPSRKERHYILLHRLIWLSVCGSIPGGLEINHKNGNKLDNRINNLELVTRSDNVSHARHKLGKSFGVWSLHEKYYPHTTTPEQHSQVLELYRSGLANKSMIARTVGVSRTVVTRIIKSER